MEKELEYIVLENNIEYIVLEKIQSKNCTYIYLSNPNNVKDFCIRKLVKDNLYGLESEEEFENSLILLKEQNKDLIEKLGL